MAECIHFPDDPNAICSLCKPKPPDDPWDTRTGFYGDHEAKYHGVCDECGGTIYPGDLIRRRSQGWKHSDCTAHG